MKGLTRTVTLVIVASHRAQGDDVCQINVEWGVHYALRHHSGANDFRRIVRPTEAQITEVVKSDFNRVTLPQLPYDHQGLTKVTWALRSQWRWYGVPLPARLAWWLDRRFP